VYVADHREELSAHTHTHRHTQSLFYHMKSDSSIKSYPKVMLNDESEYEGGRVVYVTDKGLIEPEHRVGSAIIHDNKIPTA
jgi:hypothetical protein